MLPIFLFILMMLVHGRISPLSHLAHRENSSDNGTLHVPRHDWAIFSSQLLTLLLGRKGLGGRKKGEYLSPTCCEMMRLPPYRSSRCWSSFTHHSHVFAASLIVGKEKVDENAVSSVVLALTSGVPRAIRQLQHCFIKTRKHG